MDKNAFLRELALILRQRGLSDDDIRVRIEKISSFIDGLTQEERNAVIGGNPNVAAIADKLFVRESAEKKNTESAGDQKENMSRTVMTERASEPFKIPSDYKKNKTPAEKDGGAASQNMAEIRRRDEEKLKQLKNEAQKPRIKNGAGGRNYATLSQKYESERNFWVIFFCCIPVLFFLAALLLSAFALVFFGLVGVIIILIAALAVLVAAGSAVSLIGIVYGITQLTTSVAAAVYECGIGILAAGVTMLVGVLLYNAAIRFIPWIMRKLKDLIKFVLKKLGILADYLKGVCAAI